ncbi:MAG TPA: hypothetical protein VFG92_06490 [Agromyces sp.]|nr:hypothetical protein [Agromyces sp.]
MSTMKPPRVVTAIAIAGIVATLLTGCFGNPVEDLVNRGVEDAVEGATGGDVSLGGELPTDFPTSVPLIDGKIGVAAGAGNADGWMVVITSTAADPLADAATALEGAGFAEDPAAAAASEVARVFSNDEYLVALVGSGETVTYTVTVQP